MINRVKEKIVEVKDFPKPGVGFKDITPLLQDAYCFHYVIDCIVSWAKEKKPQLVAGIESRGFVFAAPVAHRLNLGLALIRKKGKLPRKTLCVRAPNEYAIEYLEMHVDSILPQQRVVIVDDLIATGSSSISALDLVKKLGGEIAGYASVVDLKFLNGVGNIKKAYPDVDVFSLIHFEE